jgi:hypothetical protein
MVYSYCISEHTNSIDFPQELKKETTKRGHFDGSTVTAPFIGLTQTCEQIRAEFRSSYLASFPKRLRVCDIHSYIATFHMGDYTIADNIDLDTTGTTTGTAESVNLLPLFRYISHHRIVHSDFNPLTRTSWDATFDDLAEVLTHCMRRARRAEFVSAAQNLSSVVLGKNTKNVVVMVKAMPGCGMQTRKEFEHALCFDLGFSNPRFWRWSFVIKYE